MKKLTFLVTAKEYEQFLLDLREAGVVHVQQLQQGATSNELQVEMDQTRRYESAIQRMESALKTYVADGKSPVELAAPASPMALMERIEQLESEKTKHLHEVDSCQANIDLMEPWGEFDLASLERIEQACSMQVNFFSCPNKMFKQEWQNEYFAIPVEEMNKRTYFLTFSSEKPDITAECMERPEYPLSYYKELLKEQKARIAAVEQEILAIATEQIDVLRQGLRESQNAVQLSQVKLSGEEIADGVVHLMVGWTLEERLSELETMLKEKGIFYEVEQPAFEDDVPVKITNNAFSSLFEPILRMYSLPNYRDIDPSNFFAPFFMLFFGLCMGDGGYGLLILFAGLWLAFKGKEDMRQYGKLAICLGVMTVICGLATGTVFGINLTEQEWAFLAPVKQYFLADNGCGPIFGYSPMMVLSVIIGFVQVLIGMVLKGCKAWRNYGFGYAIGTFSWVVMLISAIASMAVPEDFVAVKYLLYGLMGVSALGIYLYNNPAAYKNPILGPLVNIGGGLWGTYGMATGLLGDLLSYIRLFALGLTGGILGFVFNSLALDLTKDMSWAVRWIPLCAILLFGHGLTFALSMISAFVHPMRLTFVEFFKNADYTGGGKEYQPFKKK